MSIRLDPAGQGPAAVMCGVLGDHSQQAPLAALMAEQFTVYNYDRGGAPRRPLHGTDQEHRT